MSSLEYTKKFKKILDNQQFKITIMESDKGQELPCLLIDLGKDPHQRDKILKIYIEEQALPNKNPLKNEQDISPILRVLFELELPFSFDPYITAQLSSLLHFINEQQKVTGFCMDEVNEKIYLRFHTLSTAVGIDENVLLSIIGLLVVYYDIHIKSIEEVATGKKTFDDIIQQIIKDMKKFPNKR